MQQPRGNGGTQHEGFHRLPAGRHGWEVLWFGGLEVMVGGGPSGMAWQVTCPEMETECPQGVLHGVKQGFNPGAAAVQEEDGFRIQCQIRTHQQDRATGSDGPDKLQRLPQRLPPQDMGHQAYRLLLVINAQGCFVEKVGMVKGFPQHQLHAVAGLPPTSPRWFGRCREVRHVVLFGTGDDLHQRLLQGH
ncbi:MAG: hypothetical protein R3E93_04735 [Thiothrix sp.]